MVRIKESDLGAACRKGGRTEHFSLGYPVSKRLSTALSKAFLRQWANFSEVLHQVDHNRIKALDTKLIFSM